MSMVFLATGKKERGMRSEEREEIKGGRRRVEGGRWEITTEARRAQRKSGVAKAEWE
jgi:hypothetical protein